jgi:hypothetical protein
MLKRLRIWTDSLEWYKELNEKCIKMLSRDPKWWAHLRNINKWDARCERIHLTVDRALCLALKNTLITKSSIIWDSVTTCCLPVASLPYSLTLNTTEVYVSLKHQSTSTKLHHVISQNISTLHSNRSDEISNSNYTSGGARGSVVAWGTTIQAGRSRVRFPMSLLYF